MSMGTEISGSGGGPMEVGTAPTGDIWPRVWRGIVQDVLRTLRGGNRRRRRRRAGAGAGAGASPTPTPTPAPAPAPATATATATAKTPLLTPAPPMHIAAAQDALEAARVHMAFSHLGIVLAGIREGLRVRLATSTTIMGPTRGGGGLGGLGGETTGGHGHGHGHHQYNHNQYKNLLVPAQQRFAPPDLPLLPPPVTYQPPPPGVLGAGSNPSGAEAEVGGRTGTGGGGDHNHHHYAGRTNNTTATTTAGGGSGRDNNASGRDNNHPHQQQQHKMGKRGRHSAHHGFDSSGIAAREVRARYGVDDTTPVSHAQAKFVERARGRTILTPSVRPVGYGRDRDLYHHHHHQQQQQQQQLQPTSSGKRKIPSTRKPTPWSSP